ncbi:unnamed protein product [Candida parapsilosis]
MVSIVDSLSFLDNPKINWKLIIAGFTIGQYVFETYLDYRQYEVLKNKSPPASIKAEVDQATFDKSQKYSRSKAKFSIFSSTFGLLQNLAILRFDFLPRLWNKSGSIMNAIGFLLPKFMGGSITQSIIFVFSFSVISTIVGLPLSYYSNFVLEEKYGFNKQTIGCGFSTN